MLRIFIISLATIAVVALVWFGRSTPSPETSQSGQVLIGGPISLINHKGENVTDEDFKGKYMLVYFGYTFCPDVCPTSLSIMSEALDLLGQQNPAALEQITPVFITIDPERDTVQVMAEYVPHFIDNLVGLTGSVEQVKAAIKTYRVYGAKVNADDPDGNYTMDHSSITYLMGPDGKFVSFFAHGSAPEDMAAKLLKTIAP